MKQLGNWCIQIEPYWNVNNEYKDIGDFFIRIQIEPYWNVNENALFTSIVDDGIQIEPYWNVNYVKSL